MKTPEQINIDQLYKLLREAKKKGDVDTAAALRWAIFNLEQLYGEGIK